VVEATDQQCRRTLVQAVINLQVFCKLGELLDELTGRTVRHAVSIHCLCGGE
jgi:hypothetical protein